MKFAVVSDTHFEFTKVNYLDLGIENPDEVTLILAGDINVGAENIRDTIIQYASKFKDVVWVSGNHDAYHIGTEELRTLLTELTNSLLNFYYLDNTIIELEGITIGGSTMWGYVQPEYADRMNDLKVIPEFKACKWELNNQHFTDAEWVFNNAPKVDIMVTHFCPHPQLGNPQYPITSLTQYFCPEVFDKESEEVPKYWVFGHTHYSVDRQYGNTHFISNQIGYPHEFLKVETKVYEISN